MYLSIPAFARQSSLIWAYTSLAVLFFAIGQEGTHTVINKGKTTMGRYAGRSFAPYSFLLPHV